MKTKMRLESRPCSRGNTSSTGGFSIVMLVFRGVPSRGTITYPLQELLRRMIFLTSRLVGDVFSFPRGYFHEFPAGKGEGGSVFRIRPPKRHSLLHLPKVPLLYVVLPFKNRQSAQKKQKKIVKKTPHWIPSKHPPPKNHNISPPQKKVTKHPIQHSTLNHLPIFPTETSTTQQLNNFNGRFRPVASLYLIITLSRRFSKTRMWRISGDVSLECILGRFNPSLNDDPKSFWGQPYP